MNMIYSMYRTAHGAFSEQIPNEFTAFIFPPDAPVEILADKVGNGILYRPGDAVHIMHWARVFDMILGKDYPVETLDAVRDGQIQGKIIDDECFYCDKRMNRGDSRCYPCRAGLSPKYRDALFDVRSLQTYLQKNRWDRVNTVLLHRDEVFVRMRSQDIAEGRLRKRGDDDQGYNPRVLTFDPGILSRNELIFNAEMADRTGKIKSLRFHRDD